MVVKLADNHWTPSHLHGITPYAGGDIGETVLASIKKLMPARARVTPNSIIYLIQTGLDGKQSIVWEVDE